MFVVRIFYSMYWHLSQKQNYANNQVFTQRVTFEAFQLKHQFIFSRKYLKVNEKLALFCHFL